MIIIYQLLLINGMSIMHGSLNNNNNNNNNDNGPGVAQWLASATITCSEV